MAAKALSEDAHERLARSRAWVLDLDNTLYPSECRLFDQIDERMGAFIMRYLSVELDEAKKIQKDYFYEHGTTMNGLMSVHGMDPAEFLHFVHDIDVSPVPPNPRLGAALEALEGPKIVFTNGSEPHAERVLTRLGVRDAIDVIVDIVAADYQPKPATRGYEKILADHALDARHTVMVEDIVRNLKPARALGMTTVWVPNDYEWAGSARARFQAEEPSAAEVDFIAHDLTGFLELAATLTPQPA